MTTTQTTQPIQETIMNMIEISMLDQKNLRELEDKLSKAKAKVNNSSRNIVFMQRMAQIARYDTNITQWQENINNDFGDSHDNEWTESHRLQIATFEFAIIITKKRNLKKFKHVVTVRGDKLTISENIGHVNNHYRDWDYIKNKYQGEELEKKFVNLEDARAFVQQWKDRLEADHTEALQEQRGLYQQFKDADLIYDQETAREKRRRRRYDQPLTLEEFGIVDKKEID